MTKRWIFGIPMVVLLAWLVLEVDDHPPRTRSGARLADERGPAPDSGLVSKTPATELRDADSVKLHPRDPRPTRPEENLGSVNAPGSRDLATGGSEQKGATDDVPWSLPGNCPRRGKDRERDAFLKTFRQRLTPTARLRVAPGVAEANVNYLLELLPSVHAWAEQRIGDTLPTAEVLLYRDTADLRKHGCVAKTALSYYDGAIHLANDGHQTELKRSLLHEYAHHTLMSRGIHRPVWLQEGFAMDFGQDEPRDAYSRWRDSRIDLDRMVEPLTTDATAEEVEDFYAHASIMYDFLRRLCLGRDGCGLGEQVAALRAGDTVPEELFLWTTEQRGDELLSDGPLDFWNDYEATGNFSPEVLERLLGRTRPR